MSTFTFEESTFEVDNQQFLTDSKSWDENFAEGMAGQIGIPKLTKDHWDVIRAIRRSYKDTGRCPIVYETCRQCGLRLADLKRLFSAGYLRGACRLAGITYKEAYLGQQYMPQTAEDLNVISASKSYSVDVRGFLLEPDEWDEYYAIFRAYDMKIPGGRLTEDHWKIINFLRESFKKNNVVPTVYETCEKNGIDLEQLERLFPDGYHRGAVKIAGLRVR